MNNTPFDNFNNMDDIFNELMGSMNGINSERRYLINGREVTPEEFAQYRKTGKVRNNNQMTRQGGAPIKVVI